MAPKLDVKNTFIHFMEPPLLFDYATSVSCPAAASGLDYQEAGLSSLASAARRFSSFSKPELTREALEAAGHLAARRTIKPVAGDDVSTTEDSGSADVALSDHLAGTSCGAESAPETEFGWPHSPLSSAELNDSPRQESRSPGQSVGELPRAVVVATARADHALTPVALRAPVPMMPAPALPAPLLPSAEVSLPPPPAAAAHISWFRVAYVGGIQLRTAPHFDAPRTNVVLPCQATFAAAEEIRSTDGRVYLRLADGRGWAFDDAGLHPTDPSVRRGHWSTAPVSATPRVPSFVAAPPPPSLARGQAVLPNVGAPLAGSPQAEALGAVSHVRRRRKRGGVRRNRGKRAAAAALAASGITGSGASDDESDEGEGR